MNKTARPLKTLFVKHQHKVKPNDRMTLLLKAYANNDHKRIAAVINKWLKE